MPQTLERRGRRPDWQILSVTDWLHFTSAILTFMQWVTEQQIHWQTLPYNNLTYKSYPLAKSEPFFSQ